MKLIRITALIIVATVSLTLTGCESGGDGATSATAVAGAENTATVLDTATVEIRQNDFRGGTMRTYALQTNVLAIMEGMKRNNAVVREDNPNSYWTTSGYQDFVATFLSSPIINDLQWCNEEETDWNTIVSQMTTCVQNSFTTPNGEGGYSPIYSSMAIYRNEKDDYTITGVSGSLKTTNGDFGGNLTYRILYDCDKDWCKAYCTMPLGVTEIDDVTVEMFEYARIKENVFAIQTVNERLLVVLEESEADLDIRERPIKEFYYSRLSGGMRTGFVPYEPLPEKDEDGVALHENVRKNEKMAGYSLFNEEGDFAALYGKNDSIFLQENVYATDYSWVFADGALQQAIIYKEGTLVVTTYNKLSEKYERFIYSTEKVNAELVAEIEKMVNIEGLVGIVTEKTDIPTETEETDVTTEANEMAETGESDSKEDSGKPEITEPVTQTNPTASTPDFSTAMPTEEGGTNE